MEFSSSALALTARYPPGTFRNLEGLAELVESKFEELKQRDVGQYISLKHVSERDFGFIERNRNRLASVRISYFPDIGTLIIKVPSKAHEKAHANFGMRLGFKVCNMGVGNLEFSSLAATMYTGQTGSSKEGDSSFINDTIRPEGWPLLVIEAGVSESMPWLRADAAWWIE